MSNLLGKIFSKLSKCDAEAGTNAHAGALNESVVLFGHLFFKVGCNL